MALTGLLGAARNAYASARAYALSRRHQDGHWCGEIRANVTVTAQHLFLYHCLDQMPPGGHSAYQQYILSQQNEDGSWGLAPGYGGDISTSCEAYLALRICGLSQKRQEMSSAREFILSKGGIAKVRMFTRIFFAMFGIIPWSSIPHLPPEIILLPTSFPLNIYSSASWARSTIVPLLLIRHHEPVFLPPASSCMHASWLDHLWIDAIQQAMPCSPSLSTLMREGVVSLVLGMGDRLLNLLGGLKRLGLRGIARKSCVSWIIEHQEMQGDWAGIAMPMLCSILALSLEGYASDSPEITRGLAALERFTLDDDKGKRVQACVSPHWDTVLMLTALCDKPDVARPSKLLDRSVEWIMSKQLTNAKGDWQVDNEALEAGGYCFEYVNSWYPDVDDTAATIIAMLKYDPNLIISPAVLRAAQWIFGMQSKNGGWAAFDRDNDKLWLNKIPFSDMDALCDPATADITGRVLEAFGIMMNSSC